jgi:predicted enzyme related to lactoylglutathione lyase
MNEKINYVEFATNNLGTTKKFFGDVFGWTHTDYGPEYTAFSNSGIECGVYKSEKSSKYELSGSKRNA